MSLRLDGLNPLSYMGVKPSQPPNLLIKHSAPTANDFQNINVGTFWVVYQTEQLWFLISVAGGTATWVQLYPAGGGGGGASQFPTDSGTANEVAGILNIFGDGRITTSGAGNTVTIHLSDAEASVYDTDSGSATPSGNVLNILGGTNINTSGAGDTVTVNLDNSVTLTGTLVVDGNTTLESGLTLSTLTDGVLQSNGGGVVSATNGSNGQVLIGGGTAPVWANLTSLGGTVIITNGANSINLESTGGGGGGGAGSIAFYGYQSTSYGVPTVPPGGPTAYSFGTQVSFTTTVNEGGGFYPGDGVSIPASFTAPVKGIYFFNVSAQFGAGTSTTNDYIQQGLVQLITPTLVYAGSTGQPTGNTLLVAGGWTHGATASGPQAAAAHVSATVQLDMGDAVTFGSVASAGSNAVGTQYTVLGVITYLSPGPSMPVTYVQGYLLKQL